MREVGEGNVARLAHEDDVLVIAAVAVVVLITPWDDSVLMKDAAGERTRSRSRGNEHASAPLRDGQQQHVSRASSRVAREYWL